MRWEDGPDLLQRAIEELPDAFFVKDRAHRWVAFNEAFCRVIGRQREELLGKTDHDVFPPERADRNWRIDDDIFATGKPTTQETSLDLPTGVQRMVLTRKFPMRNAQGDIMGLCAHSTDVTDLRDRLRAVERSEAELREQRLVIEAQRKLIADLAVPVVEVADGILLLPLVGMLSTERAELVMHALLTAVGQYGAGSAILDVTGVGELDGEAAELILRAVRAAALLGCQCILVGINAFAARTLVEGSVDFGKATTASTLKHGLARAMAAREWGRGKSGRAASATRR